MSKFIDIVCSDCVVKTTGGNAKGKGKMTRLIPNGYEVKDVKSREVLGSGKIEDLIFEDERVLIPGLGSYGWEEIKGMSSFIDFKNKVL